MKEEEKINQRRKTSKKKMSKQRKTGLIIAGVLVLILVIIASIFVIRMNKNGWNTKGILMTTLGQNQEDIENLEPIYCLVMGISEDISSKLTDTIMLCAYYPKTQQVSMLSIPRDTFIGKNQKSADSYDKINALYQKSPQKTVEAVEKLTGLKIDNYLVINNNALIKTIDEIGGIYFDVPIDMDYDDTTQDLAIHLKKGYQLIDGNKAEQLLRFRHNNDNTTYPAEYGTQDIGRMHTQRDFMMAAAEQILQTKNLGKVKDIVSIVFENIETNMNLADVIKYVPAALEFNTENIKTDVLPGDVDSLKPYNLSFYLVDKQKSKQVLNELFDFNKEDGKELELNYEQESKNENTNTNTKKTSSKTTNQIQSKRK